MALVEWGDAAEPVLGRGSLAVELVPGPDDTERTVTVSSDGDGLGVPVAGAGGGPRTVAGRPMTLLAIESATDMVGVALLADDGGVAERVHLGGRAHAELLVPSPSRRCAPSRGTGVDIGTIAVDVGPGLFTGLRVGVATAKALAQGLGVGRHRRQQPRHPGRCRCRLRRGRPPDVRRGHGGRGGRCPPGRGVRRRLPVRDPGRADRHRDPGPVRDDRSEPLAPEALADWLVAVAGEDGPVVVVGDGAVRYRHLLSVHRALDLRWAERAVGTAPGWPWPAWRVAAWRRGPRRSAPAAGARLPPTGRCPDQLGAAGAARRSAARRDAPRVTERPRPRPTDRSRWSSPPCERRT